MLGLAFIFTFVSFKTVDKARVGLRLLSISLFCILGIFIASGYQVAYTSDQTIYNTVTNETWVETDHNLVLPGGTDSYWMAWVFAGLGFMNIFFLVKELVIQ